MSKFDVKPPFYSLLFSQDRDLRFELFSHWRHRRIRLRWILVARWGAGVGGRRIWRIIWRLLIILDSFLLIVLLGILLLHVRRLILGIRVGQETLPRLWDN